MFRLIRVRTTGSYEVKGSVHESLSIGRARQSDLCVTDRLISGNHARLFVRGRSLRLIDLDSRNGTEVNGQRLKPFDGNLLQHGDVIDFAGRLSFRIEQDPQARTPVIQVDQEHTSEIPEGIFRMRGLPQNSPSVFEKEPLLLQLAELLLHLGDPTLHKVPLDWCQALCKGTERLLAGFQVQLLRCVDSELVRLFPINTMCSLKQELLKEALGRDQVVGLEVASQNRSKKHHSGLEKTGTLSLKNAPFWQNQGDESSPQRNGTAEIVPLGSKMHTLLMAPLTVRGTIWGMIYASSEGSQRRIKPTEKDLWLLERVRRCARQEIPQVTFAQIVERFGQRYQLLCAAAKDEGILGSSPTLSGTLECFATLVDDQQPLLLQAQTGSDPLRWLRVLHRAKGFPANQLHVLDLGGEEAQKEGFDGVFKKEIEAPRGGVIFLQHLELISKPQAKLLEDSLARRSRAPRQIVCSSPLSRRTLMAQEILSPQMFEHLASRVLRIPELSERPEDVFLTIQHYAETLEPEAKDGAFDKEAIALLAQESFPEGLLQLEDRVRVLLSAHTRPISAEVIRDAQSGGVIVKRYQPSSAQGRQTLGAGSLQTIAFGSEFSPSVALGPLAKATMAAGFFGNKE